MSVATPRCVLVPTPHGKRLRLMALSELLALEKQGKARKLSAALWEVTEDETPPAVEVPADKPQPQARPVDKPGKGKHRHGSKAK